MAQNVTIAGVSFENVPSVDIAKTGGGFARFVDSSDANAAASDIAKDKTAYVNGIKLVGTMLNKSTEYHEIDLRGKNLKDGIDLSGFVNENSSFIFITASNVSMDYVELAQGTIFAICTHVILPQQGDPIDVSWAFANNMQDGVVISYYPEFVDGKIIIQDENESVVSGYGWANSSEMGALFVFN